MRLSETLKLWVSMIKHSYQEAQLKLLILNLTCISPSKDNTMLCCFVAKLLKSRFTPFWCQIFSWKWCRCAKKDKYEVCAMHIVHESSRKMKT